VSSGSGVGGTGTDEGATCDLEELKDFHPEVEFCSTKELG
jgi:hypothetical protein